MPQKNVKPKKIKSQLCIFLVKYKIFLLKAFLGIIKAPYEKSTLVQPSACDVVSATKSFLRIVLNLLYAHNSVLAMRK